MKDKMLLINYGLIAGAIMIVSFFIVGYMAGNDPENMDFSSGELVGYTSMILALSTVFFGVKSYRDNKRNGIISFKDAFLNGLIIVLVASIIYVVGWMIYYPQFMPDFQDQYLNSQIEQIQANPELSESEKTEKIDGMKSFMESYNNPIVMSAVTFMEIFPIGLVVALICAFILKRKSGVVAKEV